MVVERLCVFLYSTESGRVCDKEENENETEAH